MTDIETIQRGQKLAARIMESVTVQQLNAPRTLQSQKRILGMSEFGACREYVRASIAGDPKTPVTYLKWPAWLGTVVGDAIEDATKAAVIESLVNGYGGEAVTQKRVTLQLMVGPEDAAVEIRISGSADIIFLPVTEVEAAAGREGLGDVVDLKSRDGLGLVFREGPPFKEKAQVSGYLVACVQEGILPAETAAGHLMYYDRSGKVEDSYTWSVDYPTAVQILDAASERLMDVARALAIPGQHAPRDEPESWCYHVQCPFYQACWNGYMPEEKIENEHALEAIRMYRDARRDRNAASDALEALKNELTGLQGKTDDGVIVRWSTVQGANGTYEKLEVREPNG
jgi:hypothetical protein